MSPWNFTFELTVGFFGGSIAMFYSQTVIFNISVSLVDCRVLQVQDVLSPGVLGSRSTFRGWHGLVFGKRMLLFGEKVMCEDYILVRFCVPVRLCGAARWQSAHFQRQKSAQWRRVSVLSRGRLSRGRVRCRNSPHALSKCARGWLHSLHGHWNLASGVLQRRTQHGTSLLRHHHHRWDLSDNCSYCAFFISS